MPKAKSSTLLRLAGVTTLLLMATAFAAAPKKKSGAPEGESAEAKQLRHSDHKSRIAAFLADKQKLKAKTVEQAVAGSEPTDAGRKAKLAAYAERVAKKQADGQKKLNERQADAAWIAAEKQKKLAAKALQKTKN